MPADRRQFSIMLNTDTDAAVIEYLEAQSNKTDAIRQALKARMEKDGDKGD